jgi:hypothetical protein
MSFTSGEDKIDAGENALEYEVENERSKRRGRVECHVDLFEAALILFPLPCLWSYSYIKMSSSISQVATA